MLPSTRSTCSGPCRPRCVNSLATNCSWRCEVLSSDLQLFLTLPLHRQHFRVISAERRINFGFVCCESSWSVSVRFFCVHANFCACRYDFTIQAISPVGIFFQLSLSLCNVSDSFNRQRSSVSALRTRRSVDLCLVAPPLFARLSCLGELRTHTLMHTYTHPQNATTSVSSCQCQFGWVGRQCDMDCLFVVQMWVHQCVTACCSAIDFIPCSKRRFKAAAVRSPSSVSFSFFLVLIVALQSQSGCRRDSRRRRV